VLSNPSAFFVRLRSGLLGPTLSDDEVHGCNAILDAMAGSPLAYTAYALATAYHETAHTMQPVKEIGGPAYFRRMYDPLGSRPLVAKRLGNTCPGDGALFCGRGYPQLTGRANYLKASTALGVDLVAHPELALRPDIAAKIMRRGMEEGWFTGRGFDAYLPNSGPATEGEFTAARAIINGSDRATLIASYALSFQAALQAGAWA